MQWDFQDHLQASSRQIVNEGTPEITYYVYDGSGQRVRKVTERQARTGETPTRSNERIYLGGFEVYREYGASGDTITLERQTLHAMDDKQRVAMVETRTQDVEPDMPAQLIRFQLGNHLGSASLELDGDGAIISYEEYHPYGSTSYQAGRSVAEVSLKRYRYTGMERDEETGLNYHGARYYAGWLGRWTSADPIGVGDGVNLFQYALSHPTELIDPNGMNSISPDEEKAILANMEAELARKGYQNQYLDVGVVTGTGYVGEEEIAARVNKAVTLGLETIDDSIVKAAFGVGILGMLYTPHGLVSEETRQIEIQEYKLERQDRGRKAIADLSDKRVAQSKATAPIFIGIGAGIVTGGLATWAAGVIGLGAVATGIVSGGVSGGVGGTTTAALEGKEGKEIAERGIKDAFFGALGGGILSKAFSYSTYSAVGRTVRSPQFQPDRLPAKSGTIFTSSDPYVGNIATEIEKRFPGSVMGNPSTITPKPGGRPGESIELDIPLRRPGPIVEVKSGRGGKLSSQVVEREKMFGRPTIGYAPDARDVTIRRWQEQWLLITNKEEELFKWIGQFL